MLLQKYKIRSLLEIEKNLTAVDNAILRVDFNITLDEKKILDTTRILASIPTIQLLRAKNIRPVLISHFGDDLSFQSIVEEISYLLGSPITFVKNLNELEVALLDKKDKNPLLLDNIRFYPGEKNKDMNFAKRLSQISLLYINDAFSVCHRDHSSITLLPQLAQVKVAGLSLVEELEQLEKFFNTKRQKGQRIALVGGKKISTKLPLLQALIQDFDQVLVMGAMANTFLQALGYDLDESYYEMGQIDIAKTLLSSNKILLPHDFISRHKGEVRLVDAEAIQGQIVDLGPKSQLAFASVIKKAAFLVWNGPAGLYEEGFSQGTRSLAQAIGEASIPSVAGGGDTLALLKQLKLENNLSYISKGGGAFLAWLINNFLPGLINLQI